MPEKFFAANQIGDVGPTTTKTPTTLLSGPPSCGKTSLLFQYALNCASESSGRAVVFICSRRRLEMKPPFLSQEIEPSSDSRLRRIQMKYVEDDDCLKKFFAAFHFHETFPSAVIIDDFGDFFSRNFLGNARGRDLAMVRTLALCHDAIMHANEKLQPTESCKLLISDTHQGDGPRLLFIYKRWIQSIFTVQGNGSGSFHLKSITPIGSRTGKPRTAKYSIAHQYLVLQEITDEEWQTCESSQAEHRF